MVDEEFNSDSQPPRPKPDYKKFWFPTPETCQNPTALNGLEKRMFTEPQKLQELDGKNPHISNGYLDQFLQKSKWNESMLKADEKQEVEELLVDFLGIFAKHRFDVGFYSLISMKLTPERDQPVYTRSPTTLIHFCQELQVEVALLQ